MLIKEAIDSLLDKRAIVQVKRNKNQFLSSYFLRPKPDNTYRFIINLKKLNKFIHKEHFKLEDLKTATKLVFPGDFMISIDLKDAYFLVPMDTKCQKFLTFKFQKKHYQFVCLPFGLCTSPYVFTKLLKPIVKMLREKGLRVVIYLDDLLVIAKDPETCSEHAATAINLLQSLGFIINFDKSVLKPSTNCKFLGMIINSVKGKSCKIINFARLLGKLVAACPAVQYGWLYTKILEREKLLALERSDENYNAKMEISDVAKADFLWWIQYLPDSSCCFRQHDFIKEISTDASNMGWGATDGEHDIFGVWDSVEIHYHINFKELLAVKLAVEELGKNLRDGSVLLRIDNTTAIAFVNRMGGVRFEKYNKLAREIWQWAEARNIRLKASYIPSRENTEADRLSRLMNEDSEWELDPYAFDQIVNKFGSPEVDIFASEQNKKCQKYFSWLPDPQALGIDAFTVSWEHISFPPFILIRKAIEKIIYDKAEGILVVPRWCNQPWFPIFSKIIVGSPIVFEPNPRLLISRCRRKQHPRAGHLSLIAAIVSGKLF